MPELTPLLLSPKLGLLLTLPPSLSPLANAGRIVSSHSRQALGASQLFDEVTHSVKQSVRPSAIPALDGLIELCQQFQGAIKIHEFRFRYFSSPPSPVFHVQKT